MRSWYFRPTHFPSPLKTTFPPFSKRKWGDNGGGGEKHDGRLNYLDNVDHWDILTANLKILTTLMRTSTRRGVLREPAERWKAGGSPGAEWTSESQGECESNSLCRIRHRYRAGGFSKTFRTPQ
jgi:hypothetical protein